MRFLVYKCALFDARTVEVNRFKLYLIHVRAQRYTKRKAAFQESILYLRSITKWLTVYETAPCKLHFCPFPTDNKTACKIDPVLLLLPICTVATPLEQCASTALLFSMEFESSLTIFNYTIQLHEF